MSDVYGTWLYPLQDWWRTSRNVKFHVHRTDGRFHFSPCEVNHNRPEREHQYMCSDQCVEMWFVDCSTEVRTCKCAAKEHHAHGSMQVLAVPITGTRYRGFNKLKQVNMRVRVMFLDVGASAGAGLAGKESWAAQ